MTEPLLSVSSGGEYIPLPQPRYAGYKTVPQEIARAGRNIRGRGFKDRVVMIQTITAQWAAVSPEQKNLILSLTYPNSFNVRFFDTNDGTFKYAQVYRGNDLDVIPLVRFTGQEFVAYDINMSLVEL